MKFGKGFGGSLCKESIDLPPGSLYNGVKTIIETRRYLYL